MSDTSLATYSKDDKQVGKPDVPQLGEQYLSKAAHRDPEKHKVGDTLPDTLVSYGEGSSSLLPDSAGNSPVMVRSIQKVTPSGVTQTITGTAAQIANASISVSCPSNAGTGAFVEVFFGSFIYFSGPLSTSPPADHYVQTVAYANGSPIPGLTHQMSQSNASVAPGRYGLARAGYVTINPGQTIGFQLVTYAGLLPGGWTYQHYWSSEHGYFSTKLYY